MQKRTVCVRNTAGIHCRPASVILNVITERYPDTVFTVVSDGEKTEINGILALISMGLCCGSKLELLAEGKDEEKAIAEIGDLFEKEFDFPPR